VYHLFYLVPYSVSDGVVEKTEGVINHGQSRDNECEHWEHKTSDEDKENTKQNT
jgi:hypothetical protein